MPVAADSKKRRIVKRYQDELVKRLVYDGHCVDLPPIEKTRAYKNLLRAGLTPREALDNK